MSTFNYAEFQTLAKDMFTEFGRSVVLNKIDRTPADSNKDWRGPANPAASPEDTVTVDAVMLDTISSRYLGLNIQREDNMQADQLLLLVATTAAPGKNLRSFDECVDGGTRYAIKALNILEPGDEEIFVAFKVAKKELWN